MDYSLIANTGIHLTTFPLEIDPQDKLTEYFHEWYDETKRLWVLDLVERVVDEDHQYFYKKRELFDNGYLNGGIELKVADLNSDNIKWLRVDDGACTKGGEIFDMTFADRYNTLAAFENQWIPIPCLHHADPDLKKCLREARFTWGALNWCRLKLVPIGSGEESDVKRYQAILAFDTRTARPGQDNNRLECPAFQDDFSNSMQLYLCDQFTAMDYCSPHGKSDYVNSRLFKLAYPEQEERDLAHVKEPKLSYIATYHLLLSYLIEHDLFPHVTLYRDDESSVDVDMAVDIGNSRTTVLLAEAVDGEDNTKFNQVQQLELLDYTNMLRKGREGYELNIYQEPFDMRLAFRRVNFGEIGYGDSRQFVQPSFIRLGNEATYLVHKATETDDDRETLSTMSSPKRYLWDSKPSEAEWKFMVLDGEKDDHILRIPGVSEHLDSDGTFIKPGQDKAGGLTYKYSRRSMMTFAFLEMLVQAQRQINSDRYRTDRGNKARPRKLRRIVITCPTAMSKVEREALVHCARDAKDLLNLFRGIEHKVEIVPAPPALRDEDPHWYYDEATCSQLVYIYGEVGFKYKGNSEEFFNLYGERRDGQSQPELIIGSLDIGAGTSDLMISRYTYDNKGATTTIKPDPLFYDSFYYAGDDMLKELVKNVMFFWKESAFRKKMAGYSEGSYRQRLRDFFGPDRNGQTKADRLLRRDFNMQYSIPLMNHFLALLASEANECVVRYHDIFDGCEPNERVRDGFKRFFGFPVEELEWTFKREHVADVVRKAFEPLLKKIATIMYAYRCDIVLLSGRPSSLSPIRDIFLKYYTVSPNRLILLNNYYVGHWYPFDENTGCIKNPKTIVAVGALIGYYATRLFNLEGFRLDTSLLDKRLVSVVNNVGYKVEGQPVHYIITKSRGAGELQVNCLPTTLNVRQIELDSYPSRNLYVIDFNREKIAAKLLNDGIVKGKPLGDKELRVKVKDEVEELAKAMPFKLYIQRDAYDKEKLTIESVTDCNGNEKDKDKFDINIQSLGTDKQYWLDSGAFDIQ